jgi:ABC-type amino acid transport system permease subunit
MSRPPEFAEQYTRSERIRYVVVGAVIGALIMALAKLWLFPLLSTVAATPCDTILGIPAHVALWYGLFTGIPLIGAILVFFSFGYRGYRILRDGQVPPLREKVFRPTRIARGRKATMLGLLHVAAFIPFAALAIWGAGQAAALSTQGQLKPCAQPARQSAKQTSSSWLERLPAAG